MNRKYIAGSFGLIFGLSVCGLALLLSVPLVWAATLLMGGVIILIFVTLFASSNSKIFNERSNAAIAWWMISGASLVAITAIVVSNLELVIQWVLIPGIFVILFLFGLVIAFTESINTPRGISVKAGFFAGLLLFVLIVFAKNEGLLSNDVFPSIMRYPILNFIIYSMPSMIFGFIFMFIVTLLLPGRGAGFLVLLIVSTSTSALYLYIISNDTKGNFSITAVSILFGVLLYALILPDKFRESLQQINYFVSEPSISQNT